MQVHVDQAVSHRVEAMIDAGKRARELRAAGEEIARHRVTSDCANLQSNGTDDPTTLGLDEQAVWHAMRETQILAGAQGN